MSNTESKDNRTHREADVLIIGAGTAGLVSRRAAEAAGARVVMVDRGPLGTTCARVGCMPSKLLIAAANAAHTVREADVFGLKTTLEIDDAAVMRRVRELRDFFVSFVLEANEKLKTDDKLIMGTATFESYSAEKTTVLVDDHTRITAKSVILATGSTPFIPPPFRGLGDALIGNDDVFELERLPKKMLVVGTGVIGLELGQALNRLGVDVTIVGINGLVGPFADPKMIRTASEVFKEELDLHTDYDLKTCERTADGKVHVVFESEGQTVDAVYDKVFCAAGRTPNTRGLNLEITNLLDERGRLPAVDPQTLQIPGAPLFLAGDVNGFRPLLHEAADEGHIAGYNAAKYPYVEVKQRTGLLAVAFTEPQIAVVGQSFRDLHCDGHRVGEVDMSRQGRARVMAENKGKIRVYADAKSGQLLGAELLSPRAENMAHLLAWAIEQRMTVHDALKMPFYHPVLEEGLRTALRDLAANLRFARQPGDPCEEFGPGT